MTSQAASFTPKAANDLLVLAIGTYELDVTSVSGGGATSWQKAVANPVSGLDQAGFDNTIWLGTVASGDVGSAQTLTVDFSTAAGAAKSFTEFSENEFSTGTGSWDVTPVDTGAVSTEDQTTVDLPVLTGGSGAELYYGYSIPGSPSGVTLAAGTPYTERLTAAEGVAAYDTSFVSGTTPGAYYTQSPASDANNIAVLLGVTS